MIALVIILLLLLAPCGLGATPLGSGCEMSEAAAEDVLSTRLATSRSKVLFEDSSRRGFRSHPLRERLRDVGSSSKGCPEHKIGDQ